jgi:hypothetical protein
VIALRSVDHGCPSLEAAGRTQSGFAILMSRMSWRICDDVSGRPLHGHDFHRQ